MRGHHACLIPNRFPEADLALLQGQRDGAEHSPRGCWGDASWRSRSSPVSCVRVSGSAPTTTEGAPGKQVPLGGLAGQGAGPGPPRRFPLPAPIPRQAQPCSGQPREQSRHRGGKGCPHLHQPHLPGLHLASLRCLRTFSFGKAAGAQLSARFSPSQRAGAFHVLLGLSRK